MPNIEIIANPNNANYCNIKFNDKPIINAKEIDIPKEKAIIEVVDDDNICIVFPTRNLVIDYHDVDLPAGTTSAANLRDQIIGLL